jgi:hypothetical protein
MLVSICWRVSEVHIFFSKSINATIDFEQQGLTMSNISILSGRQFNLQEKAYRGTEQGLKKLAHSSMSPTVVS